MKKYERETCTILRRLGVPEHLSGFTCLLAAVELAVEDPMLLHHMMGRLYPAVAQRCCSTPQRVERVMRHAIEAAWSLCDPEILLRYFGTAVDPARGKPANAEFIARISNGVRQGEFA